MKTVRSKTTGPKTCTVCFEDFGKYMKPVPCPSCPSESPPSVCKPCTQEYLLESPQDAHCMQCKHAWGYKFMHDTFPPDFITKKYRTKRQEKLLEREKGLLQQTLPLVAAEKEKKESKERIKIIREEEKALMNEYALKLKVIRDKIRKEESVARGEGSKKASYYLFPCPVNAKGTKCRGFIESEKWCCGLCEAEICKRCHLVKKKKHECKKEDIETAKMVMEETKPCPKCSVRIFKIEGCDQMFCTQCKTPFSWKTGQVVTGVIHNPHYYQMMRETGIAPRNVGDAPCGGMPWFDRIHPHSKTCNDDDREKITTAHRRCSEIERIIGVKRQKLNGLGFENIRLKWLMGEFKDEKAWQRSIFIRERILAKSREELAILDTFITGCIERFNDYIAVCNEIDQGKASSQKKIDLKRKVSEKLILDIEQIRTFCNEAFVSNFEALEYKTWPVIDFNVEYGKKRRRNVRNEQQIILENAGFDE
jgi:hypothetical protein